MPFYVVKVGVHVCSIVRTCINVLQHLLASLQHLHELNHCLTLVMSIHELLYLGDAWLLVQSVILRTVEHKELLQAMVGD